MLSLFPVPAYKRAALRAVIPLIALVMYVGPAAAAPEASSLRLSLADAQRHALSYSRQLSARSAVTAAARHRAVAAGELPDPVLKAGIDNLPASGPDRFRPGSDFMTMRRAGIAQEYVHADKRKWRSDLAQREADVAQATHDAVVVEVEREAALAWIERFYAERMAGLADAQVVQGKLQLEGAESAYRGGRGSLSDLLAARSGVIMDSDRSSELQRRVKGAQAMLARWTGLPADVPLAGALELDRIPIDLQRVADHLKHHPALTILQGQQAVAAAGVKLAQANRRPDWSVEFAYQQRGSAYGNMISFGFSVPLQWDRAKRQDRELAARLAQLDEVESATDEAFREHLAETRVRILEWQNNRERLQRYHRELVPLAAAQVEVSQGGYRAGKASLSDWLGARRNQINVEAQLLQLEKDTALGWARLNFLLPDGHRGVQR